MVLLTHLNASEKVRTQIKQIIASFSFRFCCRVCDSILILNSKSKIIPILGIFALAAYRLIPSISKISNYLQDMKFCLPAVEPFMENQKYLERFDEIKSLEKTKKINFKDKISVNNLSFKFPGTSEFILENLDFQIKKGECIGIYGRSGEGKTTLINLLLGLLVPNQGLITVDNKNINSTLKDWQKIISYIPQNVFITDDKIVNNIAVKILNY